LLGGGGGGGGGGGSGGSSPVPENPAATRALRAYNMLQAMRERSSAAHLDTLTEFLSAEECSSLGFDMQLVNVRIVCPRSRRLGLELESLADPSVPLRRTWVTGMEPGSPAAEVKTDGWQASDKKLKRIPEEDRRKTFLLSVHGKRCIGIPDDEVRLLDDCWTPLRHHPSHLFHSSAL
jgi:hypothetical protein